MRATNLRRAFVLRAVLPSLVLSAVTVASCSTGDSEPVPSVPGSAAVAHESSGPRMPRLVVLGDSLTAGLGLESNEAYPTLLQERLREAGHDVEVVNAGVSGDTSAGGLRRLDWALDGDVRVLVVALGANDGLRGLPPAEMKHNLGRIIERAKSRGIAVLLAGMEAPPNFGADYTAEFRRVFHELAREHRIPLVPFLLEGVAGQPELNQGDGIHPNASGARKIVDLLLPALEPLVVTTVRAVSASAPAAGNRETR